jgi:phage N-6-adenine-methyltransferase
MSTELVYEFDAELSASEDAELAACEVVIESGLQTFYEVGCALLKIRDGKLYRQTHKTFEDYCRGRWEFSKTHANRLIQSAEVLDNLAPIGVKPQTESQARELAAVGVHDIDAQRAVWQIALATAPTSGDGKPVVTASHIKSVTQVLKDIIRDGGLDDGSGEVKPLGVLIDAAVTEETYERMMRQKEYLKPFSKPHVAHNAGENEWYTPPNYIARARELMGAIDLDPASSDKAQESVGAVCYFTKDLDGLAHEWRGRVWMNPPYASGLVEPFTAKLADSYRTGAVAEALALVNNATETTWFQYMSGAASAILFARGRVRFLDPEGRPGAPLQGQALLYFGPNLEGFAASFGDLGFVLFRG